MRIPSNWKVNSKGQLERTFVFDSFEQALSFLNSCAELAQGENHHPDLFLHDWKKLTITLFTHSENSLTDRDTNLAELINSLS